VYLSDICSLWVIEVHVNHKVVSIESAKQQDDFLGLFGRVGSRAALHPDDQLDHGPVVQPRSPELG
jgi:hypothetical protein